MFAAYGEDDNLTMFTNWTKRVASKYVPKIKQGQDVIKSTREMSRALNPAELTAEQQAAQRARPMMETGLPTYMIIGGGVIVAGLLGYLVYNRMKS